MQKAGFFSSLLASLHVVANKKCWLKTTCQGKRQNWVKDLQLCFLRCQLWMFRIHQSKKGANCGEIPQSILITVLANWWSKQNSKHISTFEFKQSDFLVLDYFEDSWEQVDLWKRQWMMFSGLDFLLLVPHLKCPKSSQHGVATHILVHGSEQWIGLKLPMWRCLRKDHQKPPIHPVSSRLLSTWTNGLEKTQFGSNVIINFAEHPPCKKAGLYKPRPQSQTCPRTRCHWEKFPGSL